MAKVKTNTSYGGNFISVDTKTDYQAKINDAVKKGDYSTAAKAEAERNAKLTYLGRGNEATNNYVKTYTQSNGSGGKGTNNQGGTVYTNANNNVAEAPSNWTTLNVNGANYKKDSSGKIYQETGGTATGKTYSLVGDGVNEKTNEFTFSNANDAAEEAYKQYIGSGGNKAVSKDYALKNLVDTNYVNALLEGTASDYTSSVRDVAKSKKEAEDAIAAALKENSFESDYEDEEEEAVTPEPITAVDEVDDEATAEYKAAQARLEYIRNLLGKNRMHIY